MRVTFKNMINGYTGKADNSIIYYIRRTNSFYIKRSPRGGHSIRQDNFAQVMRNLRLLKPDKYYKEDLSFYLELYNQLIENRYACVITWTNLYMKVMFAMAKADPTIDLKTITKEQIHADNLPCISVKAAVEAGLLPAVKGYERFNHEM